MSGVRGDFAKLQHLVKQMRRLKADGARRVTEQLAQEALFLVQEGFKNQRAPDGSAWKPSLRARRDRGKTLMDTRRLFNSFVAKVVSSTRFRVATNVVYAAAHNFGYPPRRLVRRQFLQTAGSLPASWEKRMRKVAALALVRVMK